uniref:Timeless N-terminal domain-containing protein n=1 Tax=Photinus pyralis TaxID=7054 RepID=A0A1Y1K941_PHOPY
MSHLLSAELSATCNALGYYDSKSQKYYADTNTLETVKDLIRYLRRDDETYEIRRSLGDSQVLQTDLLPLLKGYWEQTNLFDVLLRLLVNLTSPALMLWHEVVPTEKTARYYYLKIDEHQKKYKQAFADEKIWAILSTRLSKILEIDFAIRGEENNLIIERILILVRNILYTANPDEEQRPDSDASVHDQVLWSLHQSGMLDIILFIASSTSEQAYYMHIVEILSFMLREQSATSLATTELQRSQSEKMREEAELLLMRHHENNKKQEKIRKFAGARHSRFGGTYVIKSLQSISEKNYVYHKPLNNLDSVHFDVEKKKTRTPKNRLPVQEAPTERRSAFGVKLILKEFCTEFINGAYNTFMYYVKFNFERSKAQAHDESYYLWAMRFFMEFNRGNNFQVKLVSETVSVKAFHFVQQQMETYYDYICVNKKECRSWSKRLHIALLAYRELLLTLYAMDRSLDEAVRKSAKAIKTTIFYVVEYRELIITLLLTFDEILFSRLYLNDLMETQHIFLKMLQAYCGKNELVVQKKKKRRTKKKRVAEEPVSEVEPNLEELWNEAAPQLSALLSENSAAIPDGIVPFDAASDTPISEQKTDAMKKIHQHLKDAEFENALGLLRASREVWPENDCFGSSNMAPEEELMALQDIFLANIGGPTQKHSQVVKDDEEEEYSDDEEEMEGMLEPEESNFKFDDFLKRFANQRVIQTCAYALQNIEWNSVYTNYCIIKLLHRIVWDLKMVGMVFQASIFRTFQKAYTLKDLPQFKEIITFATYVLRQFFKLTEKNPKVFMETLFWKSSRDAFDIEEGYGSYHEQTKAEAQAWNETQEMELTQLFNEHQEKEIREDVVDWIVNNLVDNTRSRRAVLKKLKSMSLLSNYKKHKAGVSRSNVWTEEDEQQLREAYEMSKEDANPIESISSRLLTQRAKTKIVAKLLEINLIQNKNEVVKGKNRLRMSKNEDRSNHSSVSEDSDSSADESTAPKIIKKRQPTTQRPSTKTKQKIKRNPQVHVSKEKLVELLRKVVHMTDALEWLHESLSDILEDRKDSNEEVEEDIPLVAIMDYSTTAIEDKDFQNLLRALQIREPADEQESHWRILGNLSSSVLEEYCQLLSDAMANNLPDVNAPTEIPSAHSDSEEDVFDRVRKITSNNTAIEVVDVLPSTSTSAPEDPVISETKDSQNVQSDSDDDVFDRANRIRSESDDGRSPKRISICDDEGDEHSQHEKVNRKRYIIESDEDEEKNENKRERNASDTDSPLKSKKRSRFISSDEDSS